MTRTARGRRILVAVFGSAGDLFPLMPVVASLREQGHDVRCAVPRSLGVYLRSARLPMYALGDGSEMRVFDDPRIVTTRFGGWASWQQTAVRYVAPHLAAETAALDRVVEGWMPHVVAATSFAAPARLVAAKRRLPLVGLSIYPQHQRQLPTTRAFGLGLRRAVAETAGLDVADARVTRLAWGVDDTTLVLHDPALVDRVELPGAGGEVVGFPYWDDGPGRPGDSARVEEWLGASDDPTVLITLGSFLGARQRAVWAETAKVAAALGVRALFVGPRRPDDDGLLQNRSGALAVGFVPLSRVAHQVDAVVHHGGLGTTFAALRAGRPAAVVPQAFDQSHNARLVERTGVGVDAQRGPLGAAVERLLAERSLAARAAEIAARLVPRDVATARIVDRILEVAG
ncbi:MAG: glycosyltransferase [Acidimicrobiales bacterium]